MLHEVELVGVITIFRQEVRPFTDEQISLVENFAAQARMPMRGERRAGRSQGASLLIAISLKDGRRRRQPHSPN